MSDARPPDTWEPHERRLWQAYRRGQWCEDVPEVRAEVVRWLLVAAPRPVQGSLARLRLRGTRITGRLDLAEADVRGAIRLRSCRLDEAPCFDGGRFNALEVRDCTLPGLTAVGARIDQECVLADCAIDGTLDLRSLSVGTRLSLNRTRTTASGGQPAIDAESLSVEEGFTAAGLECAGPVRLTSAQIRDAFTLRGARIRGGIGLYGASIGGSLHLEESTLAGTGDEHGAPALELLCATVGGDIQAGRGLEVRGCFDLRDTTVRGSVVLRGARLHRPDGTALMAERLHVGGNFDCRGGFAARGTVDLCDARIGGSAHFEGADLTGLTGPALRANGIEVGAEFNCCDGLTAHGRVSLSSITVRAKLCFKDALFDVPSGRTALTCRRSTASELALKPREAPVGTIDLRHTRVGVLRDDPATWPRALLLEGLVYDSVHPTLPGGRRLPWLDRDPTGFALQPYEQLASTYRQHGRDADARTVLLAEQRRTRATLSRAARTWSILQDLTVGYGYRPARAVWLLAALFAAGTAVFATWPPRFTGDGARPDFQPAIYTLDLLLPVVDFGQQPAFTARGATQWAAVVLVGSGWLLATTAAAGANRVLRRS
ncbi:hypothetical protein ACFY0F_30170 [Streptomyces sp. NPDC001544]|uniref:hypothetical protein n=1 Tax=Streptomyces sp. NPDC001544 TaxID=3364584 RepID=UPI0036812A4C